MKANTMSSLHAAIKTENRNDESEVHAELWQDEPKDHKINSNAREVAEICVVIGEDGAQRCSERDQPNNQSSDFDGQPGTPIQMNDREENMEWKPQQQASLRAYICGACGKKYKYYSCFRAHVRAHLENETSSASAESSPQAKNFRYMCDICGKKYKYYSCFQEHRDLHAVDDPYDQAVETPAEVKTEQVEETVRSPGSKTGSYICEYCGKRYKYYTPYQEHVALHASSDAESSLGKRSETKLSNTCEENNSSQNSSGGTSVQKSGPSSAKNGATCPSCGSEHKHCTCLRQQAHNSRARGNL